MRIPESHALNLYVGPAIVGFTVTDYTVSESGGVVSVNLALLSGVLDDGLEISLSVTTIPGAATGIVKLLILFLN